MQVNSSVITAQQLLYTRVEADYSPKGKSGFQTFFASRGLPAKEVEFIENHVKSYDTNHNGCRRQFFKLVDGQIVISQTQVVRTDPKIMDQMGRPGLFIAHCLVFSKEDFARIDHNPFWVFDHFQFVADAQVMVEHYQSATKAEAQVRIPVPQLETRLRFPADWAAQAYSLAQLSEKAFTGSAKAPTLIYGSPEAIDGCLRALFHFTQPAKRAACTFNSHIPDSSFPPQSFVFVGNPDRRGVTAEAIVNAEAHSVDMPQPAVTSSDLYLKWLSGCSWSYEDIENLAAFQELGFAFASRVQPQPTRLTEGAAEQFCRQFSDVVKKNVQAILQQSFSAEFAHYFSNVLLVMMPSKARLLTMTAGGKLDFPGTSAAARLWLVSQPSEVISGLRKKFLSDLRTLAEQANDRVLMFWMLELQGDTKHAREVLAKMNQEEYTQSFAIAKLPPSSKGQAVIYPEELVHSRFVNTMVEQMIPLLPTMQDEDFCMVIERMVGAGQTAAVSAFSQKLPAINNKYLTQLEKILSGAHNVPQDFSSVMQARRAALGVPDTFINRITGKVRSR